MSYFTGFHFRKRPLKSAEHFVKRPLVATFTLGIKARRAAG